MNPPLKLPHEALHSAIAPSWWPPAPGWWLVVAAVVIVIVMVAWWRVAARRRRAAILRLFDEVLVRAQTPSQEIAAMSELLRRAARRKGPSADTLDGEAWLRFLDAGMPQPIFSAGAGGLLRDGAFRADITRHESDALRGIARQRYLLWMQDA
ncbi:DUF4381 domain-containing protein [Thermomonas sp. HDW16]|uniref:DUF4381 domain-containing protein n=1 Tax=Thermomonas sp. HDW16 TaxID=2714945 RepID=UPI00140A39B1|nr:DUF4381 domain-containing protein [Thermomonas sp. HDW16]QIL19908.1 DUF4381 domain-containing protein [Thermomonas sp. HDW16]